MTRQTIFQHITQMKLEKAKEYLDTGNNSIQKISENLGFDNVQYCRKRLQLSGSGGLTVHSLENALYMGMKNDVSLLIDAYLNLYEAQSTWNPNMPLRDVFYLAG